MIYFFLILSFSVFLIHKLKHNLYTILSYVVYNTFFSKIHNNAWYAFFM
jgi:hypothetical protein